MSFTALGIDTSNYTTSAALSSGGTVIRSRKRLLDVPEGGRGLRQSDALFQHTVRLPELLDGICGGAVPDAVGVSERPRDVRGSYMPCFLAGVSAASAAAAALSAPLYGFSHQRGHIAAALYSLRREDLHHGKLLAFHISGGTHELLIFEDGKTDIAGRTLDISAGQLIDRVGVMTGLGFPCGAEMEKLSDGKLRPVRPSLRGRDCNLSGFENTAADMYRRGVPSAEIYSFVFSAVLETLSGMIGAAFEDFGKMPVILVGGVSSNRMITEELASRFGCMSPEPEFSSDNAAGIARLAELAVSGELGEKPLRGAL